MKWKLLVSFSPFLMVLVAFLAFVRWNGSVVLGTVSSCLLLLLLILWHINGLCCFCLSLYILILQVQKKLMQFHLILRR